MRTTAEEAAASKAHALRLQAQISGIKRENELAQQAAREQDNNLQSLREKLAEADGKLHACLETQKSDKASYEASVMQSRQELGRVRQDCDKSHAESWDVKACLQRTQASLKQIQKVLRC